MRGRFFAVWSFGTLGGSTVITGNPSAILMGRGYLLPTKSTVEGTEIRPILFYDLLGLALIESGTQALSHYSDRLPQQAMGDLTIGSFGRCQNG